MLYYKVTFQHTLSNELCLTGCFFDTGFPEYLSAALFISAIKSGLMLSHTLAVLIGCPVPKEAAAQTSFSHFKVCFYVQQIFFQRRGELLNITAQEPSLSTCHDVIWTLFLAALQKEFKAVGDQVFGGDRVVVEGEIRCNSRLCLKSLWSRQSVIRARVFDTVMSELFYSIIPFNVGCFHFFKAKLHKRLKDNPLKCCSKGNFTVECLLFILMLWKWSRLS